MAFFHVYRVTVEDSVGFQKVSVPFSTLEGANNFADRQRESHPDTWPVTITAREEPVKPRL